MLPVYNAGAPLRTAIESILAQHGCEFELIVVDDASTDGSGALALRLKDGDPRVKVIQHQENHGLSHTLNQGLELARAPLVARMDQDDEALPHRLREQVAYMNARPDVAAAGSYVYHMGARPCYDRLVQVPTEPEHVHRILKSYNCLYHPSVIMRKAVVESTGGYRADFVNAEDYELWLRLSKNHLVSNIPQALLRYRFSPGGMTLGRKWQQLYFVYLAQAVHQVGAVSFVEARAKAQGMLLATDRRYFFGEVAKGTVSELLRLRLWWDAARVLGSMRGELGPKALAGVLRYAFRAAFLQVKEEAI